MKRLALLPVLALLTVGCGESNLVAPVEDDGMNTSDLLVTAAMTDNPSACWGQASAVFAMMGRMGTHSSQQERCVNVHQSCGTGGFLAHDIRDDLRARWLR